MASGGINFAERAKRSMEKRASNRENSAAVLKSEGIAFTEHNKGAHLIVTDGDRTYNLWPGTGKWELRNTGEYRRGVFNLIRHIRKTR